MMVLRESDKQEVKRIVSIIEKHLELPMGDIHLKSRKRYIVQARQLAHKFTKIQTRLSLAGIGFLIGGKDHATVLTGINTVDNLIETDSNYRSMYKELYEKIIYINVDDIKAKSLIRKHKEDLILLDAIDRFQDRKDKLKSEIDITKSTITYSYNKIINRIDTIDRCIRRLYSRLNYK